MSDYFTNPGDPAAQTRGVSSLIRNIVTLISAGFDKVVGLSGNGGKLIRVNSGATAQEAVTFGTANQVLGMNSGATAYEHKTISGTSNEITATHGANSVTFSIPSAVTFTGKTITGGTFASVTMTSPILGTPTSCTLTNCTGLPVSTGISGLGTGVATFLATPSSANLAAAVTDETGSGSLVLANSPTLTTPNLGTPSTLVATNATGTAAGLTAGSATSATSATTATNIAGGAAGSLPYQTASGTTTLLAIGTPGYVVTVNGAGTGLEYTVGVPSATAITLLTPRAIYGNNFDGSAALTQVIASTYGGTGNGFTKFSGPTTAERTFTLPDASASLAILAANTFTGVQTMSGASVIHANASVAAHATTMNPWSGGNYVTLTGGAVTFTAMANAPQAGAEVELYMNAAHVFTDGAVFEVDGNTNYTATIGDRVLLRAKSTTVFTVHPRKGDGTAVVSTSPTVASQANMETATDNTVMVTPLATKWHPGVAKVWVVCDLAGNIAASHNVTSITDNAAGTLTITFDTDFSSTNYVCFGDTFANNTWLTTSFSKSTAGSCVLVTRNTTTAAAEDPQTGYFAVVFGDQ